MKHVCLVLGLILVTASCSPSESAENFGIDWQSNPRSAMSIASQQRAPLLIFVTSRHCLYCEKQKRAFHDPRLSQLVRRSFVPLFVEAESEGRLVQRLGVKGFPTTLVVLPNGTVVTRIDGYKPAAQMADRLYASLQVLAKAQSGGLR